MTENVNNTAEDQTEGLPPEAILADLKLQADRLGIQYHPSIGIEKLQEKITEQRAKMEANQAAQAASQTSAPAPEAKEEEVPAEETAVQKRVRQKKNAMRLVRIRVSCMNPAKKEWEGEIFTFVNRVTGEVKKFVPFNVEYHVPNCIYQQILQKQCQIFVNVKRDGKMIRTGKLIKEYAVEELPPLDKQALRELAIQQAAAAGKEGE